MKRRSLLLGVVLTVAAGLLSCCSSKDSAGLSIDIPAMEDSTSVVISRLVYNEVAVLDTVYTKGGKLKYTFDVPEDSPQFFYVKAERYPVLPLILMAGDKVSVSCDENGAYVVDGSPESVLMMQVEADINAFNAEFNELVQRLEKVDVEGSSDVFREMGKMIIARKKDAIRHIFENPYSMTNIPVLYQTTPIGMDIFGDATDGLMMRRVYDSLHPLYAASPYLISLNDEINYRLNMLEIENRVANAEAVDFPEIALNDINGEQHRLSSLKGNVIVLLFWNSTNSDHRQLSAELKPVYDRLHKRGLEIYQVGVEAEKTAWALQVKEQGLPWINVFDSYTSNFNATRLYNIESLPSLFLISREGEIIAKDIFDIAKLEAAIKSLL